MAGVAKKQGKRAADRDESVAKVAKADVAGQKGTESNPESLLCYLTEPSWKAALASEFSHPYFHKIVDLLHEEDAKGATVFPPWCEIFQAFNSTPPSMVKVVILGQDPYHDNNQAHGLCFSVRHGVKTPPSLVNIYTELASDIPGFTKPSHGNLQAWADRGVFLLNAGLTVRAHQANSHKDFGWQKFTDAAIAHLSQNCENLVFILWGGFAQKKAKLIDSSKHNVISAAHPSPLSVTKFRGCKVFSKANSFLKSKGIEPIDWQL